MSRMKDEIKKQRVKELYEMADIHIDYIEEIKQRSKEIMAMSNIRLFDGFAV